jgi:hypothetical protein
MQFWPSLCVAGFADRHYTHTDKIFQVALNSNERMIRRIADASLMDDKILFLYAQGMSTRIKAYKKGGQFSPKLYFLIRQFLLIYLMKVKANLR